MSEASEIFRASFPVLDKASDADIDVAVKRVLDVTSPDRFGAEGRIILLGAAILVARDVLGYGPNCYAGWEREVSDLARKMPVEPSEEPSPAVAEEVTP